MKEVKIILGTESGPCRKLVFLWPSPTSFSIVLEYFPESSRFQSWGTTSAPSGTWMGTLWSKFNCINSLGSVFFGKCLFNGLLLIKMLLLQNWICLYFPSITLCYDKMHYLVVSNKGFVIVKMQQLIQSKCKVNAKIIGKNTNYGAISVQKMHYSFM